MSASVSVFLAVVTELQAVLAPLNTPNITLPCVSGLERADRQSLGKDGFLSIHTEPESYFVSGRQHLPPGCSARGSLPFRQPSLCSPETLQQWRVTPEEKYNPGRAAAGQSGGTLVRAVCLQGKLKVTVLCISTTEYDAFWGCARQAEDMDWDWLYCFVWYGK